MRARGMIIAAALLLAAGGAAARAATKPAPTSAVGLSEREYRIGLYRSSVPTGRVHFNVQNFGEDGHDLAVVSPAGKVLVVSPEIKAGARATVSVRLAKPGTYRLLCTLADHAARGMKARIRVVAPKRVQ